MLLKKELFLQRLIKSRYTFLFLTFYLTSLGLGLSNASTVLAAEPTSNSQASLITANFPLGIDITGVIQELAGSNGDKLADQLAQLNVSWVRFEFKATDPLNLKNYDAALRLLQQRDIQILAVLADPFATCHSDMANRDLAVFARWAREVYLKGCGVEGPNTVHQLGFDELTSRYPFIQNWQIWNEPNVCGYLKTKDLDACGYGLWRRDTAGGERVGVRYGMQKFGTLLATVYAERANKSVKIISGGILNAYNCSQEYDPVCNEDGHPGPENCYNLVPWENFGCDAGVNLLVNSDAVQQFKQTYNRFPFDILGLHPYQPSAWANGYVPPGVYVTQDIERNVRRFVDSSYPIWITEWSFDLASNTNQPPACRFPVPSKDRSGCENNIAILLGSLISGIDGRADLKIENLFWFNLADLGPDLQTGLLDQFSRKRPTWTTFEAAGSGFGPTIRANYKIKLIFDDSINIIASLFKLVI